MVKWTYYLKLLIITTVICCVVEIGMILYSVYGSLLFGQDDTAEMIVRILVTVIPIILWCVMMLILCKKGKKQHEGWKLSHTLMAIGTGLGGIGIGACFAYVFVAVLEKLIN